MLIGKRLKESRLKRNLSQNDVANILEVHRTQIGNMKIMNAAYLLIN